MQQNAVVLIARILLSIIFILSGFTKLTNLGGTAGYFGSMGLPAPMLVAILVTALELLGGIAILIGFFTRPVAFALALFCVASGLVAHTNFADQIQMIMFLKNLSMAGGFLVLAAFGPGAVSLDARRA
ncbi:MAG: DoxX family protein [Shinella sp.]|nr:DoxX family protein [Shinella sp.]